ncbi:MAG: peptidoglycan-binding protein [Pseudomonadota bacterium]
MDLRIGILAAAPDAPDAAVQGMLDAQDELAKLGTFDNPRRVAHLIGQCAHESMRFTHDTENLFYSAKRLVQVWPSRFRSLTSAAPFAKNPEALANKVYGGRMGNTQPGDGFRFLGRGWIQLTGRDNYTTYGKMIGMDLAADPERATEPDIAWQLAAAYMATRTRSRKTLFAWADENNVEAVTRGINGGTHGLEDRRARTLRALTALGGVEPHTKLERGDDGVEVVLLQRSLATAGFSPGGQDGNFGPATEKALKAFQTAEGLEPTGISDKATWEALDAATGSGKRLESLSQTPVIPKPPAPVKPTPSPLAPDSAPIPVARPDPVLAPDTAPMPMAKPDRLPQLAMGDTGEAVLVLQLTLLRQGASISSRFGPSTEQAVRAFQSSAGLKVDGIVGPDTWAALGPLAR